MPATVNAGVVVAVATEMMPPVKLTEVTVPVPAADQVPSPRQKVDAEADVPLFRFVTGKLPVTPVVKGKPVRFVAVPPEGVPKSPPFTTKAPAEPVFTPSAVTTPVPVVVVAGAAPAPPPITKALAARAAEVAHVEAVEKYGTPPLVPATVKAKVPLVVIGEPATEMMPPVNDWATLVTVPEPATAQVPSPRQKVDAVAPVPLFRLVTGRLPVTPVVSGNPVALVSNPAKPPGTVRTVPSKVMAEPMIS